MTISPWAIYLCEQSDNISGVLLIMMVFSYILCLISILTYFMIDDDESEVKAKKIFNLTIVTSICLSVLFIIFPETNSMYKILIIPTVINSPTVKKLPDELQKFIDKELSVKKDN